MKTALDVHRALLAGDVPHEMVRLRTAAQGGDDLPRALGVPPATCVVVRCYAVTGFDSESRLVAVLLRSGDTPDPRSLLVALDAASMRPATAAEVNDATGYASGLVSPIGLSADLLLLADAALGGSDVLYAPTGVSGVALGIRVRDLLVASNARVTTLTARPLAVEERAGWAGPGAAVPVEADVLPLRRSARAAARRTG